MILVTFLNSYLKDRKQNVRINNIFSAFQSILSSVPQRSILGPILFNIFLNDLFPCIKKSDLHNFADDNTITATYNTLGRLQKYIEKSEKLAIVNSFIYANFNYYPLVWQFSACELLRKM